MLFCYFLISNSGKFVYLHCCSERRAPLGKCYRATWFKDSTYNISKKCDTFLHQLLQKTLYMRKVVYYNYRLKHETHQTRKHWPKCHTFHYFRTFAKTFPFCGCFIVVFLWNNSCSRLERSKLLLWNVPNLLRHRFVISRSSLLPGHILLHIVSFFLSFFKEKIIYFLVFRAQS